MAKKENTTSIGFEDAIWRAADKLRGNLNASEYEGVVLGLIFLKYISDKFEAKFKELSEDEYADVEDKDEYEADGVFFVPQDARWSVISQAAHTPQIGKVIDNALEAIERENTKLKGVLPSNYARPGEMPTLADCIYQTPCLKRLKYESDSNKFKVWLQQLRGWRNEQSHQAPIGSEAEYDTAIHIVTALYLYVTAYSIKWIEPKYYARIISMNSSSLLVGMAAENKDDKNE